MEGQPPPDFKCPISLEIMSDPVILASGHTFDRSSIQRWLDSGNRTCPITKLPLPDHPSLIPNLALRSLISSYTVVSNPNPQPLPPETQALFSVLVQGFSPPDAKLDALINLARRTKHDSSLRRLVAESGAASGILDCVDSLLLQEKALSLLLNLSLDDDNKVGLVADGAINRLVSVIQMGFSEDNRAMACTVLTSLAVLEVNKATIGSYPFAIESLVKLLDCGKGREVKEAATALYAVCSFPDNRRKAVDCGAVAILVRVAGRGLERAVEALSLLSKTKEGVDEMGRVFGCIRVLANISRTGKERGVQCSLLTMNSLCLGCRRLCEEARREGMVELSASLLESDNEKIRKNAVGLLETLCNASKRGNSV